MMTVVMQILRAFLGLFVDDEFLALGILSVVAVPAVLMHVLDAQPLTAGAVLMAGLLLVLGIGVLRTVRRSQP
jgi:hypothetical protein